MWITGVATVLSALAGGPGPSDLLARLAMYRHQEYVPEARIWFDRGVDPVLQRGDRVRVYYRSTESTYVAIFQVDTDGTVRLAYPRSPSENHYARADRDCQLLFPRSPYWTVDDRPGMGYFFIVTSPTPFDFSDFRYSYYDGGWDLSVVENRVYEDPYVAMDEYVARLIPDWEFAAYGLDFVSYSVGAPHEYPRFLCYDCHGFKPFDVWDPYRYSCTNFRVVVYDDPYFYPSRRYRGDRVVFVGGSFPSGPRFGFKERARGEPGTPLVRRVPAADRDDEPGADPTGRRAIPRGGVPAPEARRPTDSRDPLAGDRSARVRPPANREGARESDAADRPRPAPNARGAGPAPDVRGARPAPDTRGARPAPAPPARRPVLERRPRAGAQPSARTRAVPPSVRPTPPSGAVDRGRAAPPAARSPPARPSPSSAPAVRSPSARSKPAASKPPPRRSGTAASTGSRPPLRPRRPGG